MTSKFWRSLGGLGMAASWLAACEPPAPEPRSDSQTNWLRSCDSDRDCGALSCDCGVCTLPCSNDAECGPAPGAVCVPAGDSGALALCGGQAPAAPGLCLPRCDEGTCAEGQSCVAGSCQPLQPAGVHVSVTTGAVLGTLTGFGAAVGYADDTLASASDVPELEQAMFGELGLDVLRLRNRYGEVDDLSAAGKIVAAAARSIGRTPLVLLSSWSPPAALKQNGARFCDGNPLTCTLRTLPSGDFDYAGFAAYWRASLEAYAAAGVSPDFIGIQNNPDWSPPSGALSEACRFLPSEGVLEVGGEGEDAPVLARYPGYDRALQGVEQALDDWTAKPAIAVADVSGTRGTHEYLQPLDASRIRAIAHHFYGERAEQIDVESLSALGELERTTALPLFQSEMQADGFDTALLIHHALVTEGASMYLQTVLVGPRTGPLANPFALMAFGDGELVLQDPYYAMRHYARFTEPGFRRVAATSSHPGVLASAFLAPSGDELSVVLVNSAAETQVVALEQDAELGARAVYRSVFSGVERFASLGADSLERGLVLPPRAVATVRYVR